MRIVFVLVGLLIALVIGGLLMGLLGTGLGYCLMRLVPLSLFQATVVAQIGLFGVLSIIVASSYFLKTAYQVTSDLPAVTDDDDDDDDWEDESEEPGPVEVIVTEHRIRPLAVPPTAPAAPRRAARPRSPGTKKS